MKYPAEKLSFSAPKNPNGNCAAASGCTDSARGFAQSDLADLHLWFPGEVAGAVFAVPDRSGIMQPTPLFRSIEAAIAEIGPVAVMVDNVAATFTGNQNDRVMVRSYVNLWRTIARQASRPAVLLLDHPSLSGLSNGSGRGGNMDWRNAVRSALYLRTPDDKDEAERGIRVLETAKSNYGPTGKPVRLQWGEGGLALEHAPSSLVRIAEEAKVDEVFLRLLDKRNAQGRPVRPSNGHGYAPGRIRGRCRGRRHPIKAFKASMERLLTAQEDRGDDGRTTFEGDKAPRKGRVMRPSITPSIASNTGFDHPFDRVCNRPFDRFDHPCDRALPPYPPLRSKPSRAAPGTARAARIRSRLRCRSARVQTLSIGPHHDRQEPAPIP